MCRACFCAGSFKGFGKAYVGDDMTLRGTGTCYRSEVEVGDTIYFYKYLQNGKKVKSEEAKVFKVSICKLVCLWLVSSDTGE